MPPKGSLSAPSTLGSVEDHNGGYRMQIPQMRDLRAKRPTHGPQRTTRAQAKKDLTAAQQCASRDDMLQLVLAIGRGTGLKRPAGDSPCVSLNHSGGCGPKADAIDVTPPSATTSSEPTARERYPNLPDLLLILPPDGPSKPAQEAMAEATTELKSGSPAWWAHCMQQIRGKPAGAAPDNNATDIGAHGLTTGYWVAS